MSQVVRPKAGDAAWAPRATSIGKSAGERRTAAEDPRANEKAAEKAHETPAPLFHQVPIDSIRTPLGESPSRLTDSVSRLLDSPVLSTWGLLAPIGVDSDGVLLYGHGRLEAHRVLGRRTIAAQVFPSESLSAADRRLLQWEDNHRGPRPDLEMDVAIWRAAKPLLSAGAREAMRRNGRSRARERWGAAGPQAVSDLDHGNFPSSTAEMMDAVAPGSEMLPQAVVESLIAPGNARDKLKTLLSHSYKTVEKFAELVSLSEDDSLPVGARERIARERIDAVRAGHVDGHLKRARQIKADLERSAGHMMFEEVRHRIVRVVTLAEEALERMDFESLIRQGASDKTCRDDIDAARESARRIVSILDGALHQMGATRA